jgi:hypothetical protein
MAHVNHQSVCSVEPALWADSWQRVSAGVVRRAACRSEIPSMFAVRMRLSRSRRELSSTCIEPLDERMGSVAGRSARSLRSPRAAIGESNREPRRRSNETCVRRLTPGCRSASRKSMWGLRPFRRPQAHRWRARQSTFQGCYLGPSGCGLVALGTTDLLCKSATSDLEVAGEKPQTRTSADSSVPRLGGSFLII